MLLRSCFVKPIVLCFSILLVISRLGAESEAVFWLYTSDRYNRPTLSYPIEVPSGREPYEFIAGEFGYENWITRREGAITFLSEISSAGEVPVLCFHRLGRKQKYELTPARFRSLVDYISRNKWYPISDHQYISGDLSRVPNGFKPIVMGSDDASYGTLTYQTDGKDLYGIVKRRAGRPLLDRNSMVSILEKYAPKEEGRINFTFYISFDAVPFRQLDGYRNPGFPYAGIPLVAEKIRYLDEKFILGIHSLSHIYAGDMGSEAFAEDVLRAWELIDEYAGGEAVSLRTLSFPFGISMLTPSMRRELKSLTRNKRRLSGAFGFDDRLAPAPGALGDSFDISRYNVDNRTWNRIFETLESANLVVVRREVIWEVDKKKLPRSRYSLGAGETDNVWVLVRSSKPINPLLDAH